MTEREATIINGALINFKVPEQSAFDRWVQAKYLRESEIQNRLLTLGIKLNKAYRIARCIKF